MNFLGNIFFIFCIFFLDTIKQNPTPQLKVLIISWSEIFLDFNNFSNEGGCIIFTTKVTNPNEFGVASVDELGNVIHIEEKPEKPKSNLAVVGLYVFDSFAMDNIRKLSPSSRGEYEITDLINIYIDEKIRCFT